MCVVCTKTRRRSSTALITFFLTVCIGSLEHVASFTPPADCPDCVSGTFKCKRTCAKSRSTWLFDFAYSRGKCWETIPNSSQSMHFDVDLICLKPDLRDKGFSCGSSFHYNWMMFSLLHDCQGDYNATKLVHEQCEWICKNNVPALRCSWAFDREGYHDIDWRLQDCWLTEGCSADGRISTMEATCRPDRSLRRAGSPEGDVADEINALRKKLETITKAHNEALEKLRNSPSVRQLDPKAMDAVRELHWDLSWHVLDALEKLRPPPEKELDTATSLSPLAMKAVKAMQLFKSTSDHKATLQILLDLRRYPSTDLLQALLAIEWLRALRALKTFHAVQALRRDAVLQALQFLAGPSKPSRDYVSWSLRAIQDQSVLDAFAALTGPEALLALQSLQHAVSTGAKPTVISQSKHVNRVTVRMTVTSVDFASLAANPQLLADFQARVGLAIANQTGNITSAGNIEVKLAPGSVAVQAAVVLPSTGNSTAAQVQSALGDSTALGSKVAASVSSVPGIASVATGPISVASVSAPKVELAARMQLVNWGQPSPPSCSPARSLKECEEIIYPTYTAVTRIDRHDRPSGCSLSVGNHVAFNEAASDANCSSEFQCVCRNPNEALQDALEAQRASEDALDKLLKELNSTKAQLSNASLSSKRAEQGLLDALAQLEAQAVDKFNGASDKATASDVSQQKDLGFDLNVMAQLLNGEANLTDMKTQRDSLVVVVIILSVVVCCCSAIVITLMNRREREAGLQRSSLTNPDSDCLESASGRFAPDGSVVVVGSPVLDSGAMTSAGVVAGHAASEWKGTKDSKTGCADKWTYQKDHLLKPNKSGSGALPSAAKLAHEPPLKAVQAATLSKPIQPMKPDSTPASSGSSPKLQIPHVRESSRPKTPQLEGTPMTGKKPSWPASPQAERIPMTGKKPSWPASPQAESTPMMGKKPSWPARAGSPEPHEAIKLPRRQPRPSAPSSPSTARDGKGDSRSSAEQSRDQSLPRRSRNTMRE
eukprot:TRINITY_DN64176_c0_g1_i1.p1 TRINITY_DN64176_c0_g1~~TRINITY_DN64176_c0_g1_i1.p1  ORF type:complete len:999 (+),score=130.58 TRINITY_DN64176_c0_g1_i1:187-3183(+)